MHQSNHEYRDALTTGPARRRGAALNPGNRFESVRLHVLGEELDRQKLEIESADGKPRRVTRQLFRDNTKTIINRVTPTSDVPFNFTLNPYRGCEHGCIYCFARPYHEYLGFSSGLDFETKLVAKPDAPKLLTDELASPRWTPEPIVMSAITDVYQPIEAEQRLTRRCLEILAEARQPTTTMTKSTLVLRDTDLWQKLAHHNAGRVTVTLVTLDPKLAATLEPRAAAPRARLRIIRELTAAGIPVTVNIAPVIPGLTDDELPSIIEAVAEAGARRAAWVLLRLPYQVKDLFLDWLNRNVHPERAKRVESRIRQSRGGKLYKAAQPRRPQHPARPPPRRRPPRRSDRHQLRRLHPPPRPQSRRPSTLQRKLPPPRANKPTPPLQIASRHTQHQAQGDALGSPLARRHRKPPRKPATVRVYAVCERLSAAAAPQPAPRGRATQRPPAREQRSARRPRRAAR